MKVGTKSVIFGVHAVLIHPFFVACAWWRLFGFPWDPRLWLAFFVHDLGYLGKANMEGPEGQQHVVLGGRIMGWLCGPSLSCAIRALGGECWQGVLKAMPGGQTRLRFDACLAIHPHGTVKWRASRVHACVGGAAVGWEGQ